MLRAKDEHPEGTDDGELLRFATETDRLVLTCDYRFTVVDGTRLDTHAGVVYGDQAVMTKRPEDVGAAIDRIVSTVPPETLHGAEWYLTEWL